MTKLRAVLSQMLDEIGPTGLVLLIVALLIIVSAMVQTVLSFKR